jgi:hypothetical protein
MGFGKAKTVKKTKGPKGKKARAKAKLDRQWGETAIVDDEKQKTRRVGKSRLLTKTKTERVVPQTSSRPNSRGVLRTKEYSSKKHNTYHKDGEDEVHFSDSEEDDDSEAEAAPLSGLLSSIRKSTKKRKKAKRREQVAADESDDDEIMEEDAKDDSDMEEDQESDSEVEESDEADDAGAHDDVDDDNSVQDSKNGGDEDSNTFDLFRQRFSRGPLQKSELTNSTLTTTKVSIEGSLELHVSQLAKGDELDSLLPEDKTTKKSMEEWSELAQSSFSGNRKVLQRRWKRVQKRMTDNQAPIYPFLTRYADLLVTTESRKVRSTANEGGFGSFFPGCNGHYR